MDTLSTTYDKPDLTQEFDDSRSSSFGKQYPGTNLQIPPFTVV
jgi:hypothetical protein